ncbi:MAG: winged helix-turn-helix transcriptional regulator [Candidatus Aenigmarchaeota archaeon]|nr:winged helix-turn-helix transcriptional regulator [Candidatus Aenigmarchaeota archaeon]
MKRLLWYILAGTRGGVTRIKIISLLKERPYNINQLSSKMGMNYKSIQHHIKVLEENNIIMPSEKKYGAVYFLSPRIDFTAFDEIRKKLGAEHAIA